MQPIVILNRFSDSRIVATVFFLSIIFTPSIYSTGEKSKDPLREILHENRRLLGGRSFTETSNFFKVGIPVKIVENWSVINPIQIKCRGPVQTTSKNADFSSVGYIYNGDLTLRTEVVQIFRKFQTKTVCFQNLFGSNSVERSLTSLELSEDELKLILAEKYVPKYQTQVSHPPPICSWLRSVNQAETIYLKQEQEWSFEYGSNSLKSPYLEDGLCQAEICKTRDRNTLVFRPKQNRMRCNDFISVDIDVYLGSIVINGGVLNLPYTGSCCIQFCGRRGPLTDYGTFIALDENMANHYCKTTCDANSGLNSDLSNKVVMNTFVYFEELSRYTNCMQSRDLIMLTNKTTSNGIGNLVPSFHSKLDFAYRIMDNKIYRALVHYAPFSKIVNNNEKFCVEDASKSKLYCYNISTYIFDSVKSVHDGDIVVNCAKTGELVNGLDLDRNGIVVAPHSWQRFPVKESFCSFVNIKWVEQDKVDTDSLIVWNDTDIITNGIGMAIDWSDMYNISLNWMKYPAFCIFMGTCTTILVWALNKYRKSKLLLRRQSLDDMRVPIILSY